MMSRNLPRASALVWAGPLVALLLAGCQSLAPPGAQAPSEALGPALDAALTVLASPEGSPRDRAAARKSYRTRVAERLPELMERARTPSAAISAAIHGDAVRPDDFAEITPISRPSVRVAGLHRDGIGLPAVGRLTPLRPNTPPGGFRVPLTLVALPGDPPTDCCDAALVDPERISAIDTRHGELPVAMDLESALSDTRVTGPRFGSGLINLVRPGAFMGEPRIVFLSPFEPDKTPVVLVHGLLSTPQGWAPLVNELMAAPGFRACCQIWFFYYPTGQPVPLSALQLREALDDAVAVHRPRKPMILIGHSMGGILSRAQVSGITEEEAETIFPGVSQLPDYKRVRRALVFEPRTDVSRAVFLFTPHRGSRLASSGLGAWGVRLIRLPSTLIDEMASVSRYLAGAELERLPTSIHGLSPDSRFLRALDATRPAVPTHTILGDRGRGDGWAGSDGVVPYSSAHLPAAESEVVVPTGHGGLAHPDSVKELLRIIDTAVGEGTGQPDGVRAARNPPVGQAATGP